MGLFKLSMFLLIFCLLHLSVTKKCLEIFYFDYRFINVWSYQISILYFDEHEHLDLLNPPSGFFFLSFYHNIVSLFILNNAFNSSIAIFNSSVAFWYLSDLSFFHFSFPTCVICPFALDMPLSGGIQLDFVGGLFFFSNQIWQSVTFN